MTRRVTAVLTSLVPLALLAGLVACGDDEPTSTAPATPTPIGTDAPTTADTTADSTSGDSNAVVAGEPFPAERCEANRGAGTITYLSGFDFAATASIVEVLVAEERGYFDELCLDVEVKPSFSVENYPEIAAGNAQFSSAGSFSEIIDYAEQNDASFVALAVEGKTGIDALIVKDGLAATLEDLRGTTIGVKGRMTTSVSAMLQQAGLVDGADFTTVLLNGFDPKVHIEVPNIAGFPGFKSNEPLQLEKAAIPFTLFDPAEYDIPGSFGVLYTNGDFLAANPLAAQDFLRASMRGLADAVADPAAAAEIAVGYINANGNAMFLSPEGERARWTVEAGLVVSTNPSTAFGVPDLDLLREEVGTYAEIGMFGGQAPDISAYVDAQFVAAVYDPSGSVIWPGA